MLANRIICDIADKYAKLFHYQYFEAKRIEETPGVTAFCSLAQSGVVFPGAYDMIYCALPRSFLHLLPLLFLLSSLQSEGWALSIGTPGAGGPTGLSLPPDLREPLRLLARTSGQIGDLSSQERDLACLGCKTAVSYLHSLLEQGTTPDAIMDFAIKECVTLNLFPKDVCEPMVKLAGPEVVYVFGTTTHTAGEVCNFMLAGHCKGHGLDSWTLAIPDGKPEPPQHPEPDMPERPIRILHLSDSHVDLWYSQGSPAHCEYPVCCRDYPSPSPAEENGTAVEGAGEWGSYSNCDIPLKTLERMLSHVSSTEPEIDLVYVTGDIPAHDDWSQTQARNLESLNATMSALKKFFPSTPVLGALGNHESAPVNSFVVPAAYDDGWSMSWLYDDVARHWSTWLDHVTLEDVARGGYFSVSPLPGLRVISLNTNYCNRENWWLLLQNEDPTLELAWLTVELSMAERAGEKVHILGHIPPGGGSCENTWSHHFNSLVTRYESTVRGLFFGHTHNDEWQVMYDAENFTRPVGMAFVTPSATTGATHSPSYRIYHVDGGHKDATWAVVDHETFYLNLTEANAPGGEPEFHLGYKASSSYGVSSLTPASVDHLVNAMATDDELFKEYLRHRYTKTTHPEEAENCDLSCRKGRLCSLVTSDPTSNVPCTRISDLVDAGARQ
ncbi:sphingomyelin phosphodiesterase-like [Oratosquilla oratoria]|uniref:sphingomyelin phosphodiesterase-like n=1 Tax=Oratosquilla oratoria TaxID=337810 RepID=UPI003F7738D0